MYRSMKQQYNFSFSFSAVTQLLKFNLEKKSSELVRRGSHLYVHVQTVDGGLVGVRGIKQGRRVTCAEEEELIRSNTLGVCDTLNCQRSKEKKKPLKIFYNGPSLSLTFLTAD